MNRSATSEQMTNIISGEQYPTLSCIIPLTRGVQVALRNCSSYSEVASRSKKIQERNADNAQTFVVDELMMLETLESQAQFQVPNRSPQPTSPLETLSNSSSDSQQITSGVTGENLWEHLDKRVLEFSSIEKKY
ncbi:unnamed protein product [Arctia plantaginis]|uniref:Uncharacterized protein n=1 Tax=Arctia plantaginis TaxID=874455 RepID=A0A8S0YXV7_ARCPL|nr:unnamed protein product [Arctia plantaginis]